MSKQKIDGLYSKYGNRIASGVAECLYDRIQMDEGLTPYFAGVDMVALTDHMADMLCMITGGPDLYRGKDVKSAHASLRIDEAAFMAVVGHLVLAFDDASIDAEDGQLIVDALAGLRDQIITA